ncbi:unnamed protein product [Thelazia callipaeda]|uniref:Beta-ketoacyl-[acyl-carrier-protein] synthase I n=1 Tax=Thelazia callipaeda TaxID=103827 RepID=A0A0N5CXD1_THECL|nr:unnamed protein product [Thelazia callipaeda]
MRAAFALSWNVEWLGSFSVSGTDPETVSQRLDRFKPQKPAIAVQLSVSVSSVKVCPIDNNEPIGTQNVSNFGSKLVASNA